MDQCGATQAGGPVAAGCLMTPVRLLILLLAATLWATSVHAEPADGAQRWDRATALRYSQQALGRTVGDHRFTDRRGRPVGVADFRGKPLVVSFVYTSCYHFCPMLTRHLADVVAVANDALGSDSFAVVTVGFDSAVDTPERMTSFARTHGVEFPNWSFLSADPETVEAFTRELGFVYFPSPKGFDHLAQTTVLDAEGRVYRQIYGADFESPHLVEPLRELLSTGPVWHSGIEEWISGIRLFCTVYDPKSGRYRFDYSIVIAFGIGVLCLGGLALFIVNAWKEHTRGQA